MNDIDDNLESVRLQRLQRLQSSEDSESDSEDEFKIHIDEDSIKKKHHLSI